MWKLVIEDDEGKRTVVPLTRDDYTIGRKEGNSIRLTERNVSREHAKLHKRNGVSNGDAAEVSYILQDLTSYNGVYINGLRVADTHELAHGDLIQIGDYRIMLQDDVASDGNAAVPYDSEDLKATMPQVAGLETLLQQPNRLVMLAGPTPGTEYPLTAERATIGRAEDATISVNHNSVSRLHCEVHALGEGRFEIVDKGSSNGVRVNGADLRRGIVEAGDLIELGDVKFKFVGQGQIFRPGASESQQIAAIGHRTVAELTSGARRGRASIVPYVILGAVVGLVGAGWYYLHTSQKPEPPLVSEPAPTAPVASDLALVLDAKRVCDQGDCETAHQRVMQLPEGSSARNVQEFRDIEFKWAAMVLLTADKEADLVRKRTLLERVAQTPSVDQQVRDSANERLQMLAPGPVPVAPRDSGKSNVTAPPPGTAATRNPLVQSAPQPQPIRPPSAPRQSAFDLGASDNPSDWQKAREMLETKVYSKRASPAEVRLLKAICKKQGDMTCVDACKGIEASSSP